MERPSSFTTTFSQVASSSMDFFHSGREASREKPTRGCPMGMPMWAQTICVRGQARASSVSSGRFVENSQVSQGRPSSASTSMPSRNLSLRETASGWPNRPAWTKGRSLSHAKVCRTPTRFRPASLWAFRAFSTTSRPWLRSTLATMPIGALLLSAICWTAFVSSSGARGLSCMAPKPSSYLKPLSMKTVATTLFPFISCASCSYGHASMMGQRLPKVCTMHGSRGSPCSIFLSKKWWCGSTTGHMGSAGSSGALPHHSSRPASSS
mmetsp:Transcript_110194/g.329445  ORF Transcript_110194/g.329445 Transcript_110194/m.329445 type:complete len:266 (-) Transcript_110194:489-1286(-)